MGGGTSFGNDEDLAARLYRENLAYLRIGSFWNDAAANTVADFGLSVTKAESIPKYKGNNHYEGAWAVAEHIRQTHAYNLTGIISSGCDALVQFTLNERNNFIHGLLSTAADGKTYLTHAEMKRYALQWLGTAYEYARTGSPRAIITDNVSQAQAEAIIAGFVDTYSQEDDGVTELCLTLKVGSIEASKRISHRQKRLRALGMVCHTMEDFWCPSHTCRTYREGGQVPKYSVLAFCNYKKQNGTAGSMKGYHIPFDRYARTDYNETDLNDHTDWRMALTKGIEGRYVGTETLANACGEDMYAALQDAHRKFNTLGMNETIACITKLFEFMLKDTAWEDGVRDWIDKEVLPTHFDSKGQAIVCDAGRRSLHAPTFLIAPIKDLKRPCRKLKMGDKYEELLELAKQYDQYQRWTHELYSGKYNGTGSKYVTATPKGKSYCTDAGAEQTLAAIVRTSFDSFVGMNDADTSKFLALVGSNDCHKIVTVLENIGGMLHEFAIDLRGSDSPDATVMSRLEQTISFFKSGEKAAPPKTSTQASPLLDLIAPREALADEGDGDETYVTTDMEVLDSICYDDVSHLVALRDLDSLETSVMEVPAHTPGKDRLQTGATDLRVTYTLVKDSDEDIDFTYLVTVIEDPADDLPVSLAIGAVKSVSEGLVAIAPEEGDVLYLQMPDDMDDVPEAGAYVCAYYTRDANGTEHLLDYVELDRHDETDGGTYPVVRVYGSGMWVLDTYNSSTNYEVDGADGGHAGNDNLIYISFDSAKISPVPQEGCMATVSFHNEYYYDAEDMFDADYSDSDLDYYSENAIVSYPDDEPAYHPGAKTQADPIPFPTGTTADVFKPQADGPTVDPDLEDDADTAAYVEFDDYSDNVFDSEPLHVADTIQGTGERIPRDLLLELYGEYADDLKFASDATEPGKPDDATTYQYATNGNGTHRKYTTDPKKYTTEKCTYNSQGTCIHCCYVYKSQGGGSSSNGGTYPADGDWAWPRTRYPQVLGYTGSP